MILFPGINTVEGVVMLASTNRADILDQVIINIITLQCHADNEVSILAETWPSRIQPIGAGFDILYRNVPYYGSHIEPFRNLEENLLKVCSMITWLECESEGFFRTKS